MDAALRAETSFALAKALWLAGGDRARARTLADQARSSYAKLARPARLAEVVSWLGSHRRG